MVDAREIVDRALPYVGMARLREVLDATTNQAWRDRGITLPRPGQSATTVATRHDKRPSVQKRIVGASIDAMHERSPKDPRYIHTFLSANCFGDYGTRTGLDLSTRELPTFAMPASMGGCEPRLGGYIAASSISAMNAAC